MTRILSLDELPERARAQAKAQIDAQDAAFQRRLRGPVTAPEKPADTPKRAAQRQRHETGRMNKTEADFALELEARIARGEMLSYLFETLKFRLADRCWYTPDFVCFLPGGEIEIYETKGHMEDDAAVKLRVFREAFPNFGLTVVKKLKGGGWAYDRR